MQSWLLLRCKKQDFVLLPASFNVSSTNLPEKSLKPLFLSKVGWVRGLSVTAYVLREGGCNNALWGFLGDWEYKSLGKLSFINIFGN